MPEWINVVLLGIIEGLTEFLPISSTGHLLLAEHWLTHQTDLFNVFIQSGAVLAVLVIFTGRLKRLAAQWREKQAQMYVAKLMLSFGITGVGGLILKKLDYKLKDNVVPVAVATLVGGVLFLVIEKWLEKRDAESHDVTWGIAVAMALAQLTAAVFPGTSRSGATILAALALGMSRPAATEFSFLLGIPTLLAAGALQMFSALRHPTETIDWSMLGLGTGVAAITAFGVVKWLLRYVQHHNFNVFAWYRIAMGIGMLVWLL